MLARPVSTVLVSSALAIVGFLNASATLHAQMAGYPNGGGRLPGAMPAGPQFPGGQNVPVSYGAAQPVYSTPPTNAYAPPRGTDPLIGPPAVSYGTPQPAPQSPYQAAPGGLIAAPTVGPIASGQPTLAPPITAPVTAGPIAAGAGSAGSVAAGPVLVTQQAQPPAQAPTLAPPAIESLPPIATPLPSTVGAAGMPNSYDGAYSTPNTYVRPTPDLTTPPAIPPYSPGTAQTPVEMPVGNLNRQEISPYARGSSPPSYSAWLPRAWKPQSAPVYDNTSANSNYGAFEANTTAQSYGQEPVYGQGAPAMSSGSCGPYYPGQNCAPGVPCACAPREPWYTNVALFSTADAFKTPVDLDGLNGNFGRRVGGIASFPIFRDWGLGGQVSSSAGWYDWKGTLYTGDQQRYQNFNSIGLFARSCTTGLGFGIAHDWLYDDYYTGLNLSQFRVAASWEVNCNNEVGFWGALPQRRDSAFVGAPAVNNEFQSLTQGNLYWKHYWTDAAWTNIYAGLAESPSDISYGANTQVAVTSFLAITGAFTYVVPGSGGNIGREEEIWNLSFGLVFYPGTAMAAQRSQFRPMFAPADNGNFATWRK
jgi:hypothetical protein